MFDFIFTYIPYLFVVTVFLAVVENCEEKKNENNLFTFNFNLCVINYI